MKIFFVVFIMFTSTSFAQSLNWFISNNSPVSINKNEDAYFVDENIGYLTNNDTVCRIFKTTDKGVHWNDIYSSKNYFRSITFINEKTGWVGTLDEDVLLHTSDGGIHWEIINNFIGEKPEGICSLFKLNDNFIFGCGKYTGPAHFVKTTNCGINWYSYNLSEYVNCLVDCYFLNENTGFVVGGSGNIDYRLCSTTILATSNGGLNWQVVYKNSETRNIAWKIFSTNPYFLQVSIQSFKGVDTVTYLTSYDGGYSWKENFFKCVSPFYESLGICFINTNTGFISGIRRSNSFKENAEIYFTTDGGNSWQPNYEILNVNRFRQISGNSMLGIGRQFYRFHY